MKTENTHREKILGERREGKKKKGQKRKIWVGSEGFFCLNGAA
jgi:hypothetical protein